MVNTVLSLAEYIIFGITFYLSTTGIGFFFLPLLGIKNLSVYQKIFYGMTLGIGFLILYITLFTLLHLFYPVILIPLLIGIWFYFKADLSGVQYRFLLLPVVFILPAFVLALYPPTTWDDISAHLPVAWGIIHNHWLVFNPFLRAPAYPFNGEILLVSGLVFNDICSQLVCFMSLYAITLGIFSMLEGISSWKAAILGVALISSSQILIMLGGIAFIDIILALFCFAFLLAFMEYLKDSTKFLYLAGIFLGLAIGVKYTALIFCLLTGIVFLIRKEFKRLLIFALIVLGVSGVWYIRNVFYTGNPVWPFLNQIFGMGGLWSVNDINGQLSDFQRHGIPVNIYSFLLLPVKLCSRSIGNINEVGVSLLIWPGLIFWFFKREKNTFIPILILTFGFIIIWFMTANLIRYFVPIIAPLTLLAVFGYQMIGDKISNHLVKRFFLILFIIISFFMSYLMLYGRIRQEARGLPPMTAAARENYLTTYLPAYKATKVARRLKGRVYALCNENMYYYGEGKLIGDWFGPARYSGIFNNIDNPEAVIAYLKGFNASHLLVNKERTPIDVVNKLNKMNLLVGIYEDKSAIIYKIMWPQ